MKLIMENWKKFINEDKKDVVDDMMSSIEASDEETLKKLMSLIKSDEAGEEELEEGLMGAAAIGIGAATSALALYDMYKMLKDDPKLKSAIIKKLEDKLGGGMEKIGKLVTDPFYGEEEE